MNNSYDNYVPQGLKMQQQNQNIQPDLTSTNEVCQAIQQLNVQTDSIQQEIQSTKQQITKKQENFTQISTRIQSQSLNIEIQNKEMKKIERKQDELLQANDQILSKINDINKTLSEFQAEITSFEEKNNDIIKENSKENDENNKIQVEIENQTQECDNLEKEIQDMEKENNDIESKTTSLNNKNDEAKAHTSNIQNQITQTNDTINQLNNALNECEQKLNDYNTEKHNIEQDIEEINQSINSTDQERKELNQEVTNSKAKLNSLSLVQNQHVSGNIQQQIIYAQDQITKLKLQIDEQMKKNQQLEKMKNQTNPQNTPFESSLLNEISNETQKFQFLQRTNQELVSKHNANQKKLDDANREFAPIVEELRKLISLSLEAKSQAVQKQNETQQKLQEDINESFKLNQEISDLNAHIQDVQNKKRESFLTIQKLNNDLQQIRNQQSLEERVSQNSSQHYYRRQNRSKSRILSLD